MIFGAVPVGEAEGAILAHSLRAGKTRLKKGTRLSRDDLDLLAASGITDVIVARLGPSDIDENEAARRLAAALAGTGLSLGRAFTGRANLLADTDGVAVIDEARIHALNRVHESLTVATLHPFEHAEAGQIVATVKVIPFAAPASAVDRALETAGEGGAPVSLAPFRSMTVGLLLTELAGDKPGLATKAREVTEARLQRLGNRIAAEERCAHDAGAVAGALRRLVDRGCQLVLVFSASAVVDRGDVVPAGVIAAGGEIVHFGMPVDPGNLLLVARLGGVTVLAAPGSARSPRLHGFDWVLQRVLAGLDVGPDEITAMGVGGLLKEIVTRPQPRAGTPRSSGARPVAAIVLAAGQSRRMGERNKLLLEVGGSPMVRHAVEAALASSASPVHVVTGHQDAEVRAALDGLDVCFTHNPNFAEGLSTSLAAGVGGLAADIAAAVIVLGDMPGITAAHIDRLIAAFDPAQGREICVSTAAGKRGNPVLWSKRYFPELRELKGDVGARHLIGEHAEAVVEVEQGEAAAIDVDTPEGYRAISQGGPR